MRAQVPLVKDWREMLTEVGEMQSLAGSLRQSPYYALFKDQIEGWEKRLGTLSEGLTTMSQVQRKWVYLEPIFSRGALPEQAQRFRYAFQCQALFIVRFFSMKSSVQCKLLQ